ncbi:MAG: hypothetical protein QG671_861 [Actinomycetota bacterium]|nr:hypothetical protein [Actinomycetota bacterium]
MVDQPAAIGALVIAVTRSLGIDVGYLPGLAMRRIADLYPGEDKEVRLEAHPLAAVLTSMPGVGLRTALKILTIVGDGSAFPTAGPAPVTRRSGISIKGETRSQRGNHAHTSTLFLSAFASLRDPTSRAYYDRQRARGKRDNAALVCLARRRIDVLYALLRDRITRTNARS